MDRRVAKLGAWAGWISLIGIAGYHLAIMVLAGQRVSGTSDVAAIRAYYGQSVVGVASIEQFLVVIAVLVFAVALRDVIVRSAPADEGITRVLAAVGLVAIGIELAVVLVESSIQAALVTATSAGEPVSGLFRLWDVLYNSAAYALEATWVLAFGMAMRAAGLGPRFMRWLSPVAAALLFVNVFAVWVGIPDAATLPSALAISVWLAGAALGLGRVATEPTTKLVSQPA